MLEKNSGYYAICLRVIIPSCKRTGIFFNAGELEFSLVEL